MPYSWVGPKLPFITCCVPDQKETSFSVYSDAMCGHVLATFGLLLPSVTWKGVGWPVRRHEQLDAD